MGFTREQLAMCAGATVPDLAGPSMRLAFVGINPGLWTAMTGIHFAHPSNRFYPALHAAGIIDRLVDVSPVCPSIPLTGSQPEGGAQRVATRANGGPAFPDMSVASLVSVPECVGGGGMTEDDRRHLVERGIGITNLVGRATARAADLSTSDLVGGRARVEAFVDRHRPRVVAVAGVTAYRVAFGAPRAAQGRQDRGVGDAALWVVPNPSGLNAHETLATLAARYREPAVEAGVVT